MQGCELKHFLAGKIYSLSLASLSEARTIADCFFDFALAGVAVMRDATIAADKLGKEADTISSR